MREVAGVVGVTLLFVALPIVGYFLLPPLALWLMFGWLTW